MSHGRFIALALASSSLAPVSALAQAAAEPVGAVEEVVVTAQRRAQRLEDVPLSVASFTPQRLEAAGVQSVTDLARVTPGVRFDQTSVFVQPTIRGVGSTVTAAGTESNVSVYLDGFYLPAPLGNAFDLANITQLQVLKGPQGTLFGRNATGGAILITTSDPTFTPSGMVRVSYGSYNDRKVQGVVSGPITSHLAANLSVYARKADGYVDNIFTGSDKDGRIVNLSLRGKLLLQASDDAKLVLTLEHSDSNNAAGAIQIAVNGDSRGATVPGTIIGREFGKSAQNFPPLNRTIANAAYLRGEFKFSGVTLNSYTGYRAERAYERADLDGSSAPIFAAEWEQPLTTFTQEFTLAGSSERLDWLAGAYYFHSTAKLPFFRVASFGGPFASTITSQVESDSYAVFADATYRLADPLFLTVGGRYSTERKDFTFQAASRPPEVTVNKRWDSFTPRVALRYEIAPDTNVYASWSKGFKSGAYNAGSTQRTPVNPEKITAYEVGFKTAQADWRLDASVYYYDYKDLQFTSYDFTQGTSQLRNAAAAENYGGDVQGTWSATERLTLNAGVAYTHAEYTSFPGALGYVKNPLGGWSTTPVDASGKRAIRTPRWTANLGFSYTQPLSVGELVLGGNYAYSSRLYYDVQNRFSKGPTGLLDLRLAWVSPDKSWQAAVYGSNLTDRHYPINFVPSTYDTPIVYAWPRTVGASLEYKF